MAYQDVTGTCPQEYCPSTNCVPGACAFSLTYFMFLSKENDVRVHPVGVLSSHLLFLKLQPVQRSAPVALVYMT